MAKVAVTYININITIITMYTLEDQGVTLKRIFMKIKRYIKKIFTAQSSEFGVYFRNVTFPKKLMSKSKTFNKAIICMHPPSGQIAKCLMLMDWFSKPIRSETMLVDFALFCAALTICLFFLISVRP